MTSTSSYNYDIKAMVIIDRYVPSFIMMYLMVTFEGLIEISHHDLFFNKPGFMEYVFVGNLAKNSKFSFIFLKKIYLVSVYTGTFK